MEYCILLATLKINFYSVAIVTKTVVRSVLHSFKRNVFTGKQEGHLFLLPLHKLK